MKRYILLLLISKLFGTLYSQKYYSLLTTPPQFATSFANNAFDFLGDTLCFNSFVLGVEQDSFFLDTYLTKYSREGKLIDAARLGQQSIRSKILISEGKILSAGTFKLSTSDSIVLVEYDGKEVKERLTLWNPYEYQGSGAHFKLLEFNGQYLVFCSGLYSVKNEKREHRPYIYWINKDFSVDTLMQLAYDYGELYDYGIDADGRLNIMMVYHTNKLVSGPEYLEIKHYQGYIQFNKSKEIIHTWFKEPGEITDRLSARPYAAIYSDGTKVMTGTDAKKVKTTTILALDKDDNRLWGDTTYYDQQQEHYSFATCANGDVLVSGFNSHLTFLDKGTVPFRSSYIQRIGRDGKEKFYRSYGYFDSLGRSNGNWLYCIKEKDANSIYAIGSRRTLNKHAVYGDRVYNDSTWILHVDSIGCIDKDKCNDVYGWNAPNGLYHYDQINMRHKEWYYERGGNSYLQYFGADTAMFDRTHNWIRYRPILSRDIATGVEKRDTVYAAWFDTGRMFISGVKDCLECSGPIYLLYDFNLGINDTFALPYNYGSAKVIAVDTIVLRHGYKRKRLVLEPLNPDLKSKHGNMTWIEGIGALNGIIYFNDWKENATTELSCYYDRGEKRYQATTGEGCKLVTLIKPEFDTPGPYCMGSIPDILPVSPKNHQEMTGTWSPATIDTKYSGRFQYVYTPDSEFDADTASIIIEILERKVPTFDIRDTYRINSIADELKDISIDGVVGAWTPDRITTDEIGSFQYVFTPTSSVCASPYILHVNILGNTDTTDMDRNTVWYSARFIGDFWEGDCRTALVEVRVMRDTLIDDRLARIIGMSQAGIYYPDSEIPLYVKAGKMYFYEEDAWWLLYDFTANVGDTVTFYTSKKFPYYYPLCLIYPSGSERLYEDQILIKSIDTVYTEEGKPLKRFFTVDAFGVDFNRMEYIIERMGSINHLFGRVLVPVPYGCSGAAIRCYIDDEVHLKLVKDECDDLTAVDEISKHPVSIRPNPVSDRLEIHGLDASITGTFVSIYNMQGVELWRGVPDAGTIRAIDVSGLSAGMYFLKISNRTGTILTKRFIKI